MKKILLLMGILAFLSGCSSTSQGEIGEPVARVYSFDYDAYYSVEQMVSNAELIVVGQYTGKKKPPFNGAKNPHTGKEHEDVYMEYTPHEFKISQVLKGDIDSAVWVEINTAAGTKKPEVNFKTHTSPNKQYVLFLNKTPDTKYYHLSVYPSELTLENGKLKAQEMPKQLNDPKGAYPAAEGGHMDTSFIDGLTVQQLIEQISIKK